MWTRCCVPWPWCSQDAGFRLEIAGAGVVCRRCETRRGTRSERMRAVFGRGARRAALLSRASLFVLSSLTEGISLTLLEAMARGLPIVATHVGGNPEVVEDGVTGLLVPPRDPAALAAAVLRIAALPTAPANWDGRAAAASRTILTFAKWSPNTKHFIANRRLQKEVPLPYDLRHL